MEKKLPITEEELKSIYTNAEKAAKLVVPGNEFNGSAVRSLMEGYEKDSAQESIFSHLYLTLIPESIRTDESNIITEVKGCKV